MDGRAGRIVITTMTIVLVVWTLTRNATTQSSPTYSVTALPTLGGNSGVALAMTTSTGLNTITGYSQTASGIDHAFSIFVNSATLAATDLGTLGGARSEGIAILSDTVAGRSQVSNGLYHAFLSSSNGLIDLGTLGGSESYATGVAFTNQFVTVGASQTAGDATVRAFLYQNGAMTDLGASLGGPNTRATGINSSGHVAGYGDMPGGTVHHAFLFVNGATTDLGTLGGNSEAFAISNNDIVAGRSQFAGGTAQHAFRYANGTMTDLGTLGGQQSEAHGVNANGDVVGWAEVPQNEPHAFLWRNGTMTDLNMLIPSGSGWVLQAATGIDAGGAIAGYGQFQGQLRAFYLTPPIDLSLSLKAHQNLLDTNIPNPHEAGTNLTFGDTITNNTPYRATNITINDTVTGPLEIVSWRGADSCVQEGLNLTCRINQLSAIAVRDFFVTVRATGPGPITHSATISADQFDPNTANNSGSESNTAISLASLTLAPNQLLGGQSSLARVTLTSQTNSGGSDVKLTSSNPSVASVPPFVEVQRGSCCDDGLWREFYVTTNAVSVPTTVQISASYGLVTKTESLIVMPAGSQWPYGGTAWSIPGAIQAENFDEGGEGVAYHDTGTGNDGNADRNTDVDVQSTTDVGGGFNVGWIDPGEWLEYSVNVAQAGSYLLVARVASPGAGGTFHVEVDRVDRTGSLSVPDTGGWQVFTDVSKAITLPAGAHVVRVSFDANGPSGFIGNFNYLTFSSTSGGGPTPFGGTPWPIPGTIQAENFDDGGEQVAYQDTTAGNSGGEYRTTNIDVDIETTSDAGGGFDVGWMAAGESLSYTVSVAQSGTYTLTARVAANGAGGTFHVEFGAVDKTGALTIPDTGGWQTWGDVTKTVTLTSGIQVMRFVADSNGTVFGNLNFLRLTSSSGGSTPFGGTPAAIPGVVEAERFDEGGEGVAYHDTSAGNSGGQFRMTDAVDIETTNDVAGTYNVGWMTADEWLNYTVTVAQSGTYLLTARVAANGAGGTFHVEFGGVDKTGPLIIPNTGGWQTWVDVTQTVTLASGTQVMRLFADANGSVFGNLNYVRLSPSTGGPTPMGGTPWAVPGVIQAEDFDNGGEGIAYQDATANNDGGTYRLTGVDIESTSDAGGGHNVGWMTAGEWLNYTASVTQSGTYTLTIRVAANGPGGSFHVEFDGIDKTGTLTIPDTKDWQAWTDITVPVTLASGVQSIRFDADSNGPTGVFGNVNYIKIQ